MSPKIGPHKVQKGTANGIIIPTARGPLRRAPLVGRQGRENMNLEIEYIPVKDIVPYKNNAKLYPDEVIANCIKRAERKAGSHGR